MVTLAAAPQAMVTATRRIRRYCIVPNPPSPHRRAFRHKPLTRNRVNPRLLHDRAKCDVSAVTHPLTLLAPNRYGFIC